MLTLILLVVLGGGAGLMAVWLIDARGLSALFGRVGGRSLRRPRRRGTTRPGPATVPDTARRAHFEPLVPARGASGPEHHPVPATTPPTTAVYEPVEVPLAPLPAQPPKGRRGSARVPAAYTAVEGTYRDVARAPLWRKLVSLASLLVVLVLVGVAIAALAGATLGAVAELVDGAVG